MGKINEEIGNCDWQKFVECDEAKVVISTFASHLDKFYKICSEVEANFGTEVSGFEFNTENYKFITSIRGCINTGKIRFTEIKEENELRLREKSDAEAREKEFAEFRRIEYEKIQEKEQIDNLLCCADNLYFEIRLDMILLKGNV